MKQFAFEATGTQWAILIDQEVDHAVFEAVQKCALEFEERFSRFREDSEIGRLNTQYLIHNTQQILNIQNLKIKKIEISDELAEMLRFGKELQRLTDGYFDVNVASILEGHGYDASYSFKKDEVLLAHRRGEWFLEIEDRRSQIADRKTENWRLITNGLVKLDLGAFGKGRLIDRIAELLNGYGVKYYLIDGGRDFLGTSKLDGAAWMIALEHPFDARMAIGEFPLWHCALACSGISQRKVKDFHHFMDTKSGKPVAEPVGVFVVAQNAMLADGVSTAMAVSPGGYVTSLQEKYDVSYCVVYRSGEIIETGFSDYLYT